MAQLGEGPLPSSLLWMLDWGLQFLAGSWPSASLGSLPCEPLCRVAYHTASKRGARVFLWSNFGSGITSLLSYFIHRKKSPGPAALMGRGLHKGTHVRKQDGTTGGAILEAAYHRQAYLWTCCLQHTGLSGILGRVPPSHLYISDLHSLVR